MFTSSEEFERAQMKAEEIDRRNAGVTMSHTQAKAQVFGVLCLGLSAIILSAGFTVVCFTGQDVPPSLTGALGSVLTALALLAGARTNGERK